MVSVPCVITTPSTSADANRSFTVLASLIQTSSFMSWLPIEATWTPRTFALSAICGTAAISVSTATAPDL